MPDLIHTYSVTCPNCDHHHEGSVVVGRGPAPSHVAFPADEWNELMGFVRSLRDEWMPKALAFVASFQESMTKGPLGAIFGKAFGGK